MKSALVPILLTGVLASSACAAPQPMTNADSTDRMSVAAAFYPLEFLASRIGGDRVSVTGLTKPGADPHDAELSGRQIAALTQTRIAFYQKGLQSNVDDAMALATTTSVVDIARAARLGPEPHEHDESEAGEGDEHADEHAEDHAHEEPEGSHDGHDHGPLDPHFWLDPTRMQSVGEAMTAAFVSADPAHAEGYRDRMATLAADLQALDEDFHEGLETCAVRDLVTSHAAFAYLADHYQLHQVPISGLSPEAEPDAAALRDVIETVRLERVPTIYAEPSASPGLTRTVAEETGVRIAVLDPVESITDDSRGRDYLEVMRSNLQTLRNGQECS